MDRQPIGSVSRGARAFAWGGAIGFLVSLLGSDFLGPSFSPYVSVLTLLVNGLVAGGQLGEGWKAVGLSIAFLVAGVSTDFGITSLGVRPFDWIGGFALLGLLAGISLGSTTGATLRQRSRSALRGAASFASAAVFLGLLSALLGPHAPEHPLWITGFLAYWLPQVLGGAVFFAWNVER